MYTMHACTHIKKQNKTIWLPSWYTNQNRSLENRNQTKRSMGTIINKDLRPNKYKNKK